MALLSLNFYSHALGQNADVRIVLPERFENYDGEKVEYKTLYLLHGLGGDSTSWLRNTNLEAQFRNSDVCVVCPEVSQSFYLNQSNEGLRYFDYITDELPKYLKCILPLSQKRDDTYIAGASMGGFGAILCALKLPNKYSKVMAFSGAFDIQRLIDEVKLDDFAYINSFKNLDAAKSDIDVLHLLRMTEDLNNLDIALYCGTRDILYKDTLKFEEILDSKNIEYKAIEDDGQHDWLSWQNHVSNLLSFIMS